MRIRSAALAFVLTTLAATAAGAATSTPLPPRQFDPLGLQAETLLREGATQPLRFSFNRQQSFDVRGPQGTHWQVLSVSWQPESGGDAHCALVVWTSPKERPLVVDALAGEADLPTWSCDGEPALRFVDAPGCIRILALHPMRPPSGERFLLPVVISCIDATAVPALDARRTRWLRDAPSRRERIDTLAAMQQALQRMPQP